MTTIKYEVEINDLTKAVLSAVGKYKIPVGELAELNDYLARWSRRVIAQNGRIPGREVDLAKLAEVLA